MFPVHNRPGEIKYSIYIFCSFNKILALAGVAWWIEYQPVNRKVAGSIPSQGTCLGHGPRPQLGACERQPTYASLAHQCFSPSLSTFFPLSKSK